MNTLNNNWQILAIVLLGILQPNLAAKLIGFNGVMDNSPSVALENGTDLLTCSWFNVSLPTIFYAHGYTENVNNDVVSNISSALFDTYGTSKNIIILDWEEEAGYGDFGSTFGYALHAVPNSQTIGKKLGEVIANLVSGGLNEDIRIIGHSLGAQLAGVAGRQAISLGFTLPRITGLDPAGPIFQLDISNIGRIDASDATLVDLYHTNPGYLGMTTGTGDIDVWFNYGSLPLRQPGCTAGSNLITDYTCSHQRSVYFFCESIRNSTAFSGTKADSYKLWEAGTTNGTLCVGENVDKSATGSYYLTTNSASLYGKGEAGAI